MTPMVTDDEETVVLTLWSCSSTSVSLERGLEGTLADLRCINEQDMQWQQMKSCAVPTLVATCQWRQQLTSLFMPAASSCGITGNLKKIHMLQSVMLREFRRETLLWINVLNKASTPLSRSTMSNSNPCNCSSSHTTLLLWNVLETRDHLLELGTTICFVKRCDDASNMEMTISLASENSLMTLQFSWSAAMAFLLIFLNCFCAFFTNRM
ncbi:hypothetical protein U9M48_041136 [Paspalum notatum var. saurae]|uniref:Uncharacterized protein n=1 Tax=Paspalum notatum var. saurae TaxID=547442 RepID=A0AAQ3URY5_PASNO